MNEALKRVLEERRNLLQSIMEQAGKKISAATKAKIKAAMDALESLMGMDDADETMMESAWSPIGTILLQTMITGEATFDSYESITMMLQTALRDTKWVKENVSGYTYAYIQFTWPDHVVFNASGYVDNKFQSKTYRADYTMGVDGAVTFSNFQEWAITTVGIAVQSALIDADPVEEQVMQTDLSEPTAYIIEQGEDEQPLFAQVQSGSHIVMQGKTSDGRTIFSGIATQGDVLNKNKPGFVFPTENWVAELPKMQALIAQGKALGTFTDHTGHATDEKGKARQPHVNEYSHKFTSLMQDAKNPNLFPFTAEVMGTPAGNVLQSYFDSEVSLDMSTVAGGKFKKDTWKGQSAYVAQKQGFSWVRIADVVLQGASPGSAISEVRLQSLESAGQSDKKENAMSKEEIQAMIQAALAEGNTAEVANLQAKLTAMEAALEQAKQIAQTGALSDEDRALMQAFRATTIIQERDAKITAVTAAMVAANELPVMFQSSAIAMYQGMADTAEEVDAKLPAFKAAMGAMLTAHATMQSKGVSMKEFNDDATKKKPLNNPKEVIDDIMQSRVERGLIPKDTGVDDPSNQYRNIRIMLETMAHQHEELPVAYAMMQSRQVKTPLDMEHFLLQNFDCLNQTAIPTGAMTTSDLAAGIPYLMPIVAEMTGELIATKYLSVQPMSTDKGMIAYWKIKDQDGNNIREAANFTGSYANNPGEKQLMKKIKGGLTTETIEPTAKKVGYDLSVEAIRRLRTNWGMDGTAVMVTECAKEIAMERNYNHLQSMVSGATAGNWNYGTAIPTSNAYDGEQWDRYIMNYIASARAGIFKKTFAGSVAILGDADAISRILSLSKEVGNMGENAGGGIVSRGVDIVGTLKTGEDLVSVAWWESLGMANQLLVIGRGQEWWRSGFIYAPYLGLYVSPQWVDPETLDVEQGMLSEAAEKMVNGDYFATITIQPGVAGTKL